MSEKTEGRRRRGQQRMRWLNGITDLMYMSLSKLMRSLGCWSPWGYKESDMTEQLNTNNKIISSILYKNT